MEELRKEGQLPGEVGSKSVQLAFGELSSVDVAENITTIPVTHRFVSKTIGADAESLTLADGEPGQLITISATTAGGGAGTLTPATVTGFATVVLLGAKDTVTLQFIDSTIGWIMLGAYGTDAPPVIS